MRPTPLLLWIAAAWVAVGVVVSVWPQLRLLWWGLAMVLLLAMIGQWIRLRQLPPPVVERRTVGSLPLGVDRSVTLQITNEARVPLLVSVFDHHPQELDQTGMPCTIAMALEEVVELSYEVRALQRGDVRFGRTQLWLGWKNSLWQRKVFAGEEEVARVFPNFAPVMRYALLAAEDLTRSMGIRRRRRRGEGLDFHQLREYRQGDLLRQVDWKATSRRRQLISREYQEERDQQVVFLIDCGRRMHSKDGELSHFDHTLNAVLLLTYVALRQGDSVGFLTFSGDERWLPPVKGADGLTTVLNHVYGVRTSMQPSDYQEAASRLMSLVPRRALVVLVTNMRDEDRDELQPALTLMRRRHLVLLASLRETVAEEILAEPVMEFRDALRFGSAQQYLSERQRAHQDLDTRGAMVLDVAPRDLAPSIVNRYLDIKRAGIL